METITCPRCGAANDLQAINCRSCHINLQFALNNPGEIERLAQEKPLTGTGPGPSITAPKPLGRPILHLLGSFAFAFLLGEAVHEIGHALAHRAYGHPVVFVLDPFGGSKTLGSASPEAIWGPTTAAGPLFNLLLASFVLVLIWRWRRPGWLPLLLWGPVAWIQEGVTFSLGMLTPGGDADLLVRWGIPPAALIGCGILLLAAGVIVLARLLPLAGLSPHDSFSHNFTIVSGGMLSFMLLRLLGSTLTSPGSASENVLPLIFAFILAIAVVLLFQAMPPRLLSEGPTNFPYPGWPVVWPALASGAGMILMQLIFYN